MVAEFKASPAGQSIPRGQGSIHEEAHLGLSQLIQSIFKALRLVAPTSSWSSMFHLLTTLLEKNYFQQSRVHLILLNFSL